MLVLSWKNIALGVGSRSLIKQSAMPRALWASRPHPLCYIFHTTLAPVLYLIHIYIYYIDCKCTYTYMYNHYYITNFIFLCRVQKSIVQDYCNCGFRSEIISESRDICTPISAIFSIKSSLLFILWRKNCNEYHYINYIHFLVMICDEFCFIKLYRNFG